jgi:hypothetical protein
MPGGARGTRGGGGDVAGAMPEWVRVDEEHGRV